VFLSSQSEWASEEKLYLSPQEGGCRAHKNKALLLDQHFHKIVGTKEQHRATMN
jgi:hypothetical protein